MENIKLYINAGIDDVKIYLEQLFNNINKRNPKFEELFNKVGEANIKNNFWNSIYDKLNIYSNLLLNNNNGCDISTIKFLLFGIGAKSNKVENVSLEVYEQSMYSNEINNFRNCVIIILIQNYILLETKDKENLSENNSQNILNNVIKIIKF